MNISRNLNNRYSQRVSELKTGFLDPRDGEEKGKVLLS